MFKTLFKNIGPGPLIAAAFIGPGTVTLCVIAGVQFGYTLLWAMLLSILITLSLQEMSARLGIVSQKGLSEILRSELKHPIAKILTLILVLTAIVVGNAAYEAGNISGGALGLETIFGNPYLSFGNFQFNGFTLCIGALAFALLYFGNYKILERLLITLVIFMSLAFLITAIIIQPNVSKIINGLFVPSFPEGSSLIIIGIIGTTVVPYNIFLHASLAKTKWQKTSSLSHAKKDTIIAVALGGLISICIIIPAAILPFNGVKNAADLANALKPLFGDYAKYCIAIGLIAAGLTSAITAPLAASYVTCGCLGWSTNLKSKRFRWVWMSIIGIGIIVSSLGLKPIEVIKFAQIANGILLPIIVGLLLWIMNKSAILGAFKNSKWQNSFGIVILIITIILGTKAILQVFQLI